MWPTCVWLLKVQSGLFGKVWQRLFLFSHREHGCRAVCTGITQEQKIHRYCISCVKSFSHILFYQAGACIGLSVWLCQYRWNREKPLIWYISEQDDVAAALQYSARTVGCVSTCTSTPAMQICSCSCSFDSIGNGGEMLSCAWIKW